MGHALVSPLRYPRWSTKLVDNCGGIGEFTVISGHLVK